MYQILFCFLFKFKILTHNILIHQNLLTSFFILIVFNKTAKAKAGKKRQLVLKFAKKMFRLKQNQPLTLQVKEPSQAFLEEEIDEKMDSRLPKEVIYMLKGRLQVLYDIMK